MSSGPSSYFLPLSVTTVLVWRQQKKYTYKHQRLTRSLVVGTVACSPEVCYNILPVPSISALYFLWCLEEHFTFIMHIGMVWIIKALIKLTDFSRIARAGKSISKTSFKFCNRLFSGSLKAWKKIVMKFVKS